MWRRERDSFAAMDIGLSISCCALRSPPCRKAASLQNRSPDGFAGAQSNPFIIAKNPPPMGTDFLWRRERDSNPRYDSSYTRFPVVRLRPSSAISARRFVAPLLSYNKRFQKARYIFLLAKLFSKTSCIFLKCVYNDFCSRGISTVGSAQRSQC